MPRWTSCWVDPRAINNEGQWGEYICEHCGKHFKARMCTKKKVKHVFCSTKCKKDSQVNYKRPRVNKQVYRRIYKNNYNLVKTESFRLLEGKNLHLLEDCMQIGFIELWRTYNRNKMDCSKKYLRKAVRHAILDKLHWWLIEERKYYNLEDFIVDKASILCYNIEGE